LTVFERDFICKRWLINEAFPTFMNYVQVSYIKEVKVKVPRNRLESPEGGRGIALHSLDLGARRGWVVSITPRPLYPRKRPGTHCTGGWVGPRACLDVCEKSRPYRDSIPRPPKLVASRHTD
jgi:hypothetical protein